MSITSKLGTREERTDRATNFDDREELQDDASAGESIAEDLHKEHTESTELVEEKGDERTCDEKDTDPWSVGKALRKSKVLQRQRPNERRSGVLRRAAHPPANLPQASQLVQQSDSTQEDEEAAALAEVRHQIPAPRPQLEGPDFQAEVPASKDRGAPSQEALSCDEAGLSQDETCEEPSSPVIAEAGWDGSEPTEALASDPHLDYNKCSAQRSDSNERTAHLEDSLPAGNDDCENQCEVTPYPQKMTNDSMRRNRIDATWLEGKVDSIWLEPDKARHEPEGKEGEAAPAPTGQLKEDDTDMQAKEGAPDVLEVEVEDVMDLQDAPPHPQHFSDCTVPANPVQKQPVVGALTRSSELIAPDSTCKASKHCSESEIENPSSDKWTLRDRAIATAQYLSTTPSPVVLHKRRKSVGSVPFDDVLAQQQACNRRRRGSVPSLRRGDLESQREAIQRLEVEIERLQGGSKGNSCDSSRSDQSADSLLRGTFE